MDDNQLVHETFAFEDCSKHIKVFDNGIVFYKYSSRNAEDKQNARIQEQESAHKKETKIKTEGGKASAMHKSGRTHTSPKGVKRTIYTKNGNDYVKMKNKNTGKFYYKLI